MTRPFITLVDFAAIHDIDATLFFFWLMDFGIINDVGAIRQTWIDQNYFLISVCRGQLTNARLTTKGLEWLTEMFEGTYGG